VSTWDNGSPNHTTGAGFGVRIKSDDRDKYFNRQWISVKLTLGDNLDVETKLTRSFWRKCPELRGKYIGQWLIKHGLLA